MYKIFFYDKKKSFLKLSLLVSFIALVPLAVLLFAKNDTIAIY